MLLQLATGLPADEAKEAKQGDERPDGRAGQWNPAVFAKMVDIGRRCTRDVPEERPLMQQVAEFLSKAMEAITKNNFSLLTEGTREMDVADELREVREGGGGVVTGGTAETGGGCSPGDGVGRGDDGAVVTLGSGPFPPQSQKRAEEKERETNKMREEIRLKKEKREADERARKAEEEKAALRAELEREELDARMRRVEEEKRQMEAKRKEVSEEGGGGVVALPE